MTYIDELFNLLHLNGNRFFKVSFKRRTPKLDANKNVIEPEGTIREMVCRLGVKAFKKNKVTDEHRNAEDLRCGVLTVFDIQQFLELRGQGVPRNKAGRKSWRRLNLCGIVELKPILDREELPIVLRPKFHKITNKWQLRQLAMQETDESGNILLGN